MHPVALWSSNVSNSWIVFSFSSSQADLMNVICQIFNSISLLRPTAHLRTPPAPALCEKANGILAQFHPFLCFKLMQTNCIKYIATIKHVSCHVPLQQVYFLKRHLAFNISIQCTLLQHMYICISFNLFSIVRSYSPTNALFSPAMIWTRLKIEKAGNVNML